MKNSRKNVKRQSTIFFLNIFWRFPILIVGDKNSTSKMQPCIGNIKMSRFEKFLVLTAERFPSKFVAEGRRGGGAKPMRRGLRSRSS